MFRWLPAAAVVATLGCSADPAEIARNQAPLNNVSPDVFTGVWRSVTPSLEFVGLFVNSKSSEIGVLGTRLTLSGLYWEGGGKIDGDSFWLPSRHSRAFPRWRRSAVWHWWRFSRSDVLLSQPTPTVRSHRVRPRFSGKRDRGSV